MPYLIVQGKCTYETDSILHYFTYLQNLQENQPYTTWTNWFCTQIRILIEQFTLEKKKTTQMK